MPPLAHSWPPSHPRQVDRNGPISTLSQKEQNEASRAIERRIGLDEVWTVIHENLPELLQYIDPLIFMEDS